MLMSIVILRKPICFPADRLSRTGDRFDSYSFSFLIIRIYRFNVQVRMPDRVMKKQSGIHGWGRERLPGLMIPL